MLYFAQGGTDAPIDKSEMEKGLRAFLDRYPEPEKVLIIPPDFTRYHSAAGILTELAWKLLGDKVKAVLPALGTHFPMTAEEKKKMFGDLPDRLIVDHDWRGDVAELGRISGEEMSALSGGRLDFDWPVQVNRLLTEDWDLILSIGQVVPHAIVGMANYTKNILVGTGGKEGIDKSHFMGGVCNMELIMGRAESPVRKLFDRGAELYCRDMPIVYIQTVVAADAEGTPRVKGLFIGDDRECYEKAAALALKENVTLMDEAPRKIVAYLDPEEFKSTWLANKSIYRTRMVLADDGELIILAPGVHCFGESESMDALIRKYGYPGTSAVLEAVKKNEDLAGNLSVAAHLIHGSAEGRFRITYCPGGLNSKEIEQAGFDYGDLDEYEKRYNPAELKEGWNTMEDGERIFFISKPALGLWALKEKFEVSEP